MLWAKGDISNPNNIKIGDLKKYNNGSWEEIEEESSDNNMSLPIQDVIKMLPIPFDDEVDIVVLKVHCAVDTAIKAETNPYRYKIVDNYPINRPVLELVSVIGSYEYVSFGDTVNKVQAPFIYCNGCWLYNITLSQAFSHPHIEDEDLDRYEEKEAYAVFPIVLGNTFGQAFLSDIFNWSNCPQNLLENNKATWKELNEFL